jgi:phosphoglycerate dehydrogenase-like enzyme
MKIVFAPPLGEELARTAAALTPAGCTLHFVDECDRRALGHALHDAAFFLGLPRIAIDQALFAMAPQLKLIQLLRRGLELVDRSAARAHQVPVATVEGDVHAGAVAEHTLMLLLAVMRRLPWQMAMASEGNWAAVKPWKQGKDPAAPSPQWGCELRGRTLGILGLGAIGRAVVRLAQPFGLQIVYCNRQRLPPPEEAALGVSYLPLPALLRSVDIVSLHLPLAAGAPPLLGERELAALPRGAVVINTSRGGLIDHAALARALDSGHLAGAGLDVLDEEPPAATHPLVRRDNVILTPHAAWLSQQAWPRLFRAGFANIERWLAGQPLVGLC